MEQFAAAEWEVHVLACAKCPRVSTVTARGWRAFLVGDPVEDDRPLAFCCPACGADGA